MAALPHVSVRGCMRSFTNGCICEDKQVRVEAHRHISTHANPYMGIELHKHASIESHNYASALAYELLSVRANVQ